MSKSGQSDRTRKDEDALTLQRIPVRQSDRIPRTNEAADRLRTFIDRFSDDDEEADELRADLDAALATERSNERERTLAQCDCASCEQQWTQMVLERGSGRG